MFVDRDGLEGVTSGPVGVAEPRLLLTRQWKESSLPVGAGSDIVGVFLADVETIEHLDGRA